jgi:hypothetical protein
MIYYLPNIQSDFDGFSAVTELYTAAQADKFREVEINLSRLTSFDANMCAPFGVVLAKLADAYKAISLVNPPSLSSSSSAYDFPTPSRTSIQSTLERNGFLANFGWTPPEDVNPTSLPYQRFKLAETKLFDEYLATHLPGKGLPTMTSEFALLFQQSLFEIFANASWHSDSKLGVFSCGQFFPMHHRLDIAIADAGIGIPRKINEAFGVTISPVSALRWALQEGHTTKRGNPPGGVGLKLLKDFIQINGGCVQIASGGAFWQFKAGKETFSPLAQPFPGTAVNLEVNTDDPRIYRLAATGVQA